MSRIPFNSGWVRRTPQGPFSAGPSGEEVPVQLPDDALRDEERSADAPGRGSSAYYPNGAYTYLKRFSAPAEWDGAIVRLEFEGAYRHAQVFLNNDLVANRSDGYARFFVDLTPFLLIGEENELRVEVRAGQDSRWYSGAGLHRPVSLHVDETLHIMPDGIEVDTVRLAGSRAVLEVRTRLRNAGIRTRTARASTKIIDPDGEPVATATTPSTLIGGEDAVVRQRLYIDDAALWSPDDPQLHTLQVALDDAEPVEVRFGIRTVTVDPSVGLEINGKPVTLRGASIHHDNGPLGAAAIGRAEERRVTLLKEAGFNAIRSAHNPISSAMLDACDRLGVLVMDEAFDMWTRAKSPLDYALDFPRWWREDIAAMVAKDRNHPSVIMYSIGNEIAETGSRHGARIARELAEHVRALDPTRLVTNAVNALLASLDDIPALMAEFGGLNQIMSEGDYFGAVSGSQVAGARIEESSAALDVLGLNYGESRYAQDARLHPERIIAGSESFPSQIGKLWPMVTSLPHVIGDFTWAGWDYLGEVGLGSTNYTPRAEGQQMALEREFPFLAANTGDLDITGYRRPVSYYREIVYGLRSEPYIAVHRPDRYDEPVADRSPWGWSDSVASWTWPGYEGRRTRVEVYCDAEEVGLHLDGQEIGRHPVGEEIPMLARFDAEYGPGTLEALAYRGGHVVGRTTLATAGEPRLTATADRTELTADDADLAFVAIEFRDDSGRLVAAHDNEVIVQVSGAGRLAGMCSANPSTTERFDADRWRTFDGRALAVIRPTGAGTIEVRVSSDGHDDVRIGLRAGETPGPVMNGRSR